MNRLVLVLLFAVAALIVCLLVLLILLYIDGGNGPGPAVKRTADLEAVIAAVEQWKASDSQREALSPGAHRTMHEGDGATVDGLGYAKLNMSGCLFAIYRNSNLGVRGIPSESAPACIVGFEHGTIYNQVKTQTIVQTEWAVIRTLGTQFLVHLDPARGLLWVIVKEGSAEVEAAGQRVVLGPGQQTWVYQNRPPEPARPATRREVGDLFPRLENLTNGLLPDSELLEPVAGTPGEPPTEAPSIPPTAPSTKLTRMPLVVPPGALRLLLTAVPRMLPKVSPSEVPIDTPTEAPVVSPIVPPVDTPTIPPVITATVPTVPPQITPPTVPPQSVPTTAPPSWPPAPSPLPVPTAVPATVPPPVPTVAVVPEPEVSLPMVPSTSEILGECGGLYSGRVWFTMSGTGVAIAWLGWPDRDFCPTALPTIHAKVR
jgi:hypothetical protein